ncbi:MAG: 30S ribosomal protein S15 [Candidatus Nealsonbacteria bacterium]|nr:30S ribosomal protein S15 [Candidatus Nealsonbacteria bacterium]
MLGKEAKSKIIKGFKVHETDIGSDEVQVGLLSEEITRLLFHLKKNPKDFHSKRGLLKMVSRRRKFLKHLKMVSRRRKFLKHLKQEDEKKYAEVIKKIGFKK